VSINLVDAASAGDATLLKAERIGGMRVSPLREQGEARGAEE
jgi:hypothetical protein